MNPATEAGIFLVNAVFDLAVLVFVLRFLFEWARADFNNPISQFIARVTSPIIKVNERIIPRYRHYNLPSLVTAFVFFMFKIFFILLLQAGHMPALAGLALWTVGGFLSFCTNVFFFMIIIQVVVSWIQPQNYHPLIGILHKVTEPLMAPARRLVPPMGGLDLSPIVVLLALQLFIILVCSPLVAYGAMHI